MRSIMIADNVESRCIRKKYVKCVSVKKRHNHKKKKYKYNNNIIFNYIVVIRFVSSRFYHILIIINQTIKL